MIKKLRSLVQREKAFTLVELLIVIAIIAILTVAFLPGALKAPAKARDAGRQKAIRDIQAAVESYIVEHNGNIPPADTSLCFLSTHIAAGNFNPLPMDPRPPSSAANASCNNGTQNAAVNAAGANKYFYRNIGDTNYVIGAVMEVRGSGNTCAAFLLGNSAGTNCVGLGAGTPVSLRDSTFPLIDNSDEPVDIPDLETPYFIAIGPVNI